MRCRSEVLSFPFLPFSSGSFDLPPQHPSCTARYPLVAVVVRRGFLEFTCNFLHETFASCLAASQTVHELPPSPEDRLDTCQPSPSQVHWVGSWDPSWQEVSPRQKLSPTTLRAFERRDARSLSMQWSGCASAAWTSSPGHLEANDVPPGWRAVSGGHALSYVSSTRRALRTKTRRRGEATQQDSHCRIDSGNSRATSSMLAQRTQSEGWGGTPERQNKGVVLRQNQRPCLRHGQRSKAGLVALTRPALLVHSPLPFSDQTTSH